MSADKYVMNKDGTVIDLETHQKDIASQEGGIAAQEKTRMRRLRWPASTE